MLKFAVIVTFNLILWNFSSFSSANPLSPTSIAKKIHNGGFETVKGVVYGATEVVGTPVSIEEVHFYLHTSRDNGYPNHTVDPREPAEIGHTKGKIFFLIHGWTSSREKSTWYRALTEFILKKYMDSHVVHIDWSKAAADNYAFAAFSTESVGQIIANVIYRLIKEEKVPLENFVLIGHSLGGQISGWTGKKFHELSNQKLPRIIALDPAGPLFIVRPNEKKLNKNDADVVMVLHSDGGKLGYESACGTIDFFPNGGSDQPGCYKVDLAKISTLSEPLWCDHQRAYNLFVEAIKSPQSFLAKKCKSYSEFKKNSCEDIQASLGDLETTLEGNFYLETSDTSPFIKIIEDIASLTKHNRPGDEKHSSTEENVDSEKKDSKYKDKDFPNTPANVSSSKNVSEIVEKDKSPTPINSNVSGVSNRKDNNNNGGLSLLDPLNIRGRLIPSG